MKEIINMFKKAPVSQKLEEEIRNTKFKTTIPTETISRDQWFVEFKVSIRHGKVASYIG